jgi:hypothetical protein
VWWCCCFESLQTVRLLDYPNVDKKSAGSGALLGDLGTYMLRIRNDSETLICFFSCPYCDVRSNTTLSLVVLTRCCVVVFIFVCLFVCWLLQTEGAYVKRSTTTATTATAEHAVDVRCAIATATKFVEF